MLFDQGDKPKLAGEKIKLFTGNSNRPLAQSIAEYLEIPLVCANVTRFSDGEVRVKIEENIRGVEAFVIQPTCQPVNDNLMELLVMLDALKRASVSRVTAVIPYFGYAKQEKKTTGREPISAKLVANLITIAGASRIITLDLHSAAIQGFFDIPVDNLYALPILSNYYKQKGLSGSGIVVVSPDVGGVARASALAERLGAGLAITFKRRPEPEVAETKTMVGDVEGRTAILIDDMISTGHTMMEAAKLLKNHGAQRVFACATHPIFTNTAETILNISDIEELVFTDSIPYAGNLGGNKIVVLSVAKLLGEAIRRNYFNQSVSSLFE